MTRWVVNAMNVIGSRPDKWWNDPEKAMRRMAVTLNDFATSEKVTELGAKVTSSGRFRRRLDES